MAQVAGQSNILRKEISYFDGVNATVSSNIAKKEEITHCENVRSPMIGTVEKREGMTILGTDVTGTYATTNYGLFYFYNILNGNNGALYKISKIGGVNTIYYLDTATNIWTALTGLGVIGTNPTQLVSTHVAETDLYLANSNFTTRYISGADGTTVTDSTTATGNLFGCPNANLINYYKGKLYVADYTSSGVRYRNTVLMSSDQLGILALVNNDTKTGETVIPVTDNKYFIAGETVQIYRGATPITTAVIASVQETTVNFTVATTVPLLAADEIWVNNTYNGKKVFRWVANPSTMGVNSKDYDTFKMSSTTDNDNETITMLANVGNYMAIATNNNIAVWNGFVLQNLDLGVGCVSPAAHVKSSGSLYFLHYTGIYETAGGMPKYLSTKVEPYIQGATRAGLEAACAGKKGKNIFFAIGDVTFRNPDGSIDKILPDVCLEYSIVQENWYVHTNWNLQKMTTYYASFNNVGTNPDELVGLSYFTNTPAGATATNPVVELLSSGVNLDINDEIPFRLDTPNIMLGSTFQMIAYPQEVHLELERGSGVKCFVSLDFADWYELQGEASKGATIFKVTSLSGDVSQPPRCRNIRLSFRHNGKQLCKISKAAVLYMITPEEQAMTKEDYTN